MLRFITLSMMHLAVVSLSTPISSESNTLQAGELSPKISVKQKRVEMALADNTIVKVSKKLHNVTVHVYEPVESFVPEEHPEHCKSQMVELIEAKMDPLDNGTCATHFRDAIAAGDGGNFSLSYICPCVELLSELPDFKFPDCTPLDGTDLTFSQVNSVCVANDAAESNLAVIAEEVPDSQLEDDSDPEQQVAMASFRAAAADKKASAIEHLNNDPEVLKQCSTKDPVSETEFIHSLYEESFEQHKQNEYELSLLDDEDADSSKPIHVDSVTIRGFEGNVEPKYDPNAAFDILAYGDKLEAAGELPTWYTNVMYPKDGAHIQNSTAFTFLLQHMKPDEVTELLNHRAKRHGRSLKSRIKSKFYRQAKKESWKELKNQAVPYAKQRMYNAYKSRVPNGPTSWECKQFFSEVDKMEDHFNYFVKSPMEQIDEKGNSASEHLERLQTAESDLRTYSTAILVVQVVVRICGFLPYVGQGFFTPLGHALRIFKRALDQTKNKLIRFNNAFTDKVKPKVDTIVEKNAEAAEKIETAEWALQEYGVEPTLLMDDRCSQVTKRTVCSSHSRSVMSNANNHLQTVRNEIEKIKNAIKIPFDFLSRFAYLLLRDPWVSIKRFLNGLSGLLRPFTDLINTRICFPYPTVKIGCARIWCGASCGWGGCRSHYCNVCAPYPAIEQFCFTVRQVLEGIANVIGIIMDGLMGIIKGMIPGVPSIPVPSFGFPGLPGIPHIHLPNFPSINFPHLGFPCLGGGWPHVSNGMISHTMPGCHNSWFGKINKAGCFAPPGISMGLCTFKCP